MDGRWCTKEDVQEDLARATGQRPPDVDEGFFVYGERPPPPRICGDEDAEVEHQYGHAAGPGTLQQHVPDLRGITKMLQMVQDYGSSDLVENSSKLNSPMTANDDVIVIRKLKPQNLQRDIRVINQRNLQQDIGNISKSKSDGSKPQRDSSASRLKNDVILLSKLNPNVKEFIPKSEASPSSQKENKISSGSIDVDTRGDRPIIDIEGDAGNVNGNIIEQRGAESDQYEKERAELAAMLKSKIYSAPEDDSFQFRRQKYAAIANLLKLHAAPPAVELRTPASFESGAAVRESIPTPPAPAPVDERELRASIRKVSDWLHGESAAAAAAPAPPPHLGAVSYKRKQQRGAAPSPPAATAECKQPRAYVPSAHAHELGRRYAARAASASPPRGLWDRLHDDLRRRDDEIRRRIATAGPDPEPRIV